MTFAHPGGNSLLSSDYNVFKSIHPQERYELIMRKYNYTFDSKVIYNFHSDLAKQLQELQIEYSHKAPSSWWIRFIALNVILFYTEKSFLINATLVNSISLGIIYALLGLNIGHDGSHGAVGNKYIN